MKRIQQFIFATLALCLSLVSLPTRADCVAPGDPVPEVPADLCVIPEDSDADWLFLATHSPPEAIAGEPMPPCPAIDNWSGSRLFDSSLPLPPGLLPYCRYTAVNSEALPSNLLDNRCEIVGNIPTCFGEVDAERLVVTGQGTGTTENILWPDFRTHFLQQSGAPGPLGTGTTQVRITVVDTEPSGAMQELDGPGIADHGFGLLNVARDMLCNNAGPCDVELRSSIGLPLQRCSSLPGASCPCSDPEPSRTGFCTTPAAGGHLGSQGDVAAGIFAAMRNYEVNGPARHVINLSLGWDPRYGGTPPLTSAPLGVQAVIDALEYASCRGALVIASAGNRVTGPESTTGPLMPGAWEGVPAPTEVECDDLLGSIPYDPSLFASSGGYRPLLYAVGAVDERNEKQRVRIGGEPRLTAFGDHAIGDWVDAGTTTPTGFLTGTSVSALAVSVSAAAAWHFRPSVPSYQIMGAIYAGSTNLQRPAEFCQDAANDGCAGQTVRRVFACDAIDSVCSSFSGAMCPQYACPPRAQTSPGLDIDALNTAFSSVTPVDINQFSNELGVPECGQGYVIRWESGQTAPTNPCPHNQFYAIQVTPYADGQPEGDVCESCSNQFASPGNYYLEVVDDFLSPVNDVTLLCNGEGYHVANQLMPGDKLKVINIPESCESSDLNVAFRVPSGNGTQASVLSLSIKSVDSDGDGIQNGDDNCTLVANPAQLDTDGDNIGNACDADLNNDCVVNVIDLGIFRTLFFTGAPLADFNNDGVVNVVDLGVFRTRFFGEIGPTGLPTVLDCF